MIEFFENFKEWLDKHPFILIIGKYDHVLGPRVLYSSVSLKNEEFIENLLGDALNTTNKYVNFEYNQFYSQVCKTDVEDLYARGRKQLYALILLRDKGYPMLPIIHFQRIEMMFRSLGDEIILSDNLEAFNGFFNEINKIFLKRDILVPLEECNIKVRRGVNTILGFCDFIIELKTNGTLSDHTLLKYIEMMRESAKEILSEMEKMFST